VLQNEHRDPITKIVNNYILLKILFTSFNTTHYFRFIDTSYKKCGFLHH